MWSRKVVTLFLIFRTLSLPDLSDSQCKVWLFSHNSASCPHHRLDLWDIRTPWRREGTLEEGGKGRKGKRLVPIYTWTNIDNSNIHKLIWIRTLNSKTCLSFQCQEISACLWERLEAEDRITRSVCVCLLRADIRNRGRADSQGTPLWFNLFKRQKGSYSGATFVHLCVYMKEGLSACKPPHMRTHTQIHTLLNTQLGGQHWWGPSSTEAPLYVQTLKYIFRCPLRPTLYSPTSGFMKQPSNIPAGLRFCMLCEKMGEKKCTSAGFLFFSCSGFLQISEVCWKLQ